MVTLGVFLYGAHIQIKMILRVELIEKLLRRFPHVGFA